MLFKKKRQLSPCSFGLPASSTFLSEQTSHQQPVLFSHNKSAPAINHQPNEQALYTTS
jgi:hypothetical protein